MNKPKCSAPLGTKFAVGWTNASSSAPAPAPTGNRLVGDKTNRFVNLDLGGFEPTSVTIAKRMGQPGEVVKEVGEVVVKKAAPRPPKVNELLLPLGLGESLWDPKMNPIRLNNILGGWGVTDKGGKRAKSRRNK